MEVLKCILLREGYLQKLRTKLEIGTKAQAERVSDMMDLVRQATVETVDAIETWRQKSDRAFVWNGMNYLLKIPSDLDFLEQSKPLMNWLGFRFGHVHARKCVWRRDAPPTLLTCPMLAAWNAIQ